jgi:hypothetical protein
MLFYHLPCLLLSLLVAAIRSCHLQVLDAFTWHGIPALSSHCTLGLGLILYACVAALLAVCTDCREALLAAYLQQPETTCKALELAVRNTAVVELGDLQPGFPVNVLATTSSGGKRAQDQQQPNQQQQQQQQRQQQRKGQQAQKQQQAHQDKQAFAVAVSSFKLAAVMLERGKEHPSGKLWLSGVVGYFRGLIGNALEIAAGLSSSASAAQQATQAAGDSAAAAAAASSRGSRVSSSSSSAGPSSRPPAGASSMALLLVARCFLFGSKLLGAAAAALGEDDIKSEAAAATTVAGSDVDAAGVTTDVAAGAAGAAADLTVETAGSARSVAVPALEDAAAEKGKESTAAGPAVSDAAAAAAVDSAPSCNEMLLAAQQAATIYSLDSTLRDCSAKLEWLGQELQSVELFGGPGSEWGRAAARQQLLQLQSDLQQGLQDAVVRSSINSIISTTTSASSSDSDSSRDGAGAGQADNGLQQIIINSDDLVAALPAIAQQMVALGEALCAQLPLPHCCNHPGCVELRGASELQLVGGKSCVCSRCRCG